VNNVERKKKEKRKQRKQNSNETDIISDPENEKREEQGKK